MLIAEDYKGKQHEGKNPKFCLLRNTLAVNIFESFFPEMFFLLSSWFIFCILFGFGALDEEDI